VCCINLRVNGYIFSRVARTSKGKERGKGDGQAKDRMELRLGKGQTEIWWKGTDTESTKKSRERQLEKSCFLH